MTDKDFTSCCGLYCPDCIWFRNNFSYLAKELLHRLKEVNFEKYASIKSPFGSELQHYREFLEVANFIAKNYCAEPCRKVGGCAGKPCKIMLCAESKGLEGCWQCEEMGSCEKFDFLKPRCGDTPYRNLLKIKELGYEEWIKERSPHYIISGRDKIHPESKSISRKIQSFPFSQGLLCHVPSLDKLKALLNPHAARSYLNQAEGGGNR